MGLESQNKINQLMMSGIRNGLYFSEWLKKNGYSDQLVKKYRQSGWLTSLSKGVMYRTGESPSAYAAIYSYNEQLCEDVRIAAHSALELFGFNHYVPMGKPILMVTGGKQSLPKWMLGESFERAIKFFGTGIFPTTYTSNVQIDGLNILVSSPEQAFMECLLLAPAEYNYIDLYYIIEQLTSLRPEIVQSLLESIKNVRVKRMFLYMAEKAEHYWFDMLDSEKIDIGTSKLQLVKNGIYISRYKITIPKELNEYE